MCRRVLKQAEKTRKRFGTFVLNIFEKKKLYGKVLLTALDVVGEWVAKDFM